MNFWWCNADTSPVHGFTERAELKCGSEPSRQVFGKAQAGKLCEKLIERSVNYPSTLGVNNWDFGFKKFEPLGNVKVWMNFKAKNAFGLELKYTATCTFEPGNPNGEIVVKERTS